MKRLTIFISALVLSLPGIAQNAIFVSQTNGVTDVIALSAVEQTFTPDGKTMVINDHYNYATDNVVDITYATMPKKIMVKYDGATATVINPFVLLGVTVEVDGAHVTINNPDTDTEIATELTGTTTSGSFTYNGSYKTTITLNGVDITNPTGAAIDIQCGKRVALELKKETVNKLADGPNGTHKATLYCKGHLEIDKSGDLTVSGSTKHAISAKEYIEVKNGVGTITILSAESDGIHAGQYFLANGGSFIINNVGGDAIQAELSGAEDYAESYPDGSMTINGGSFDVTLTGDDVAGLKADGDITITNLKSEPDIHITVSGKSSKCLKADNTITIDAGTLVLSPNGAMVIESTDASYSTAIKCTDYVGNGGELRCTAQGEAARAISAGNNLTINGGTYIITNNGAGKQESSNTYTAKGLKADGAMNLVGGDITISMSGDGGKGILTSGTLTIGDQSTNLGPKLRVTTTGSKLGSTSTSGGGWGGGRPGGGGGRPGESSSGSSAKGIKAQGAINVYGAELEVSTATEGAEGMESKSSILIAGGQSYFKCYDDCINCAGAINLNDGIVVCYSNGNDAIDSNYGKSGAVAIRDASVLTYSTKGGAEMGLDCDGMGYVQITGNANVVALGGNQGGSSSSIGSSTQGYAIVTSSTNYSSAQYYTLADASGNNLLTFKLEGNVNSSCALYTAAGMARSASHTVKSSTSAPTDATLSFHGLYLGSSAKGTSSVLSFTSK